MQRLHPALSLGRDLEDAGGRHQREAGVGARTQKQEQAQHVLGTMRRLNLSVHRASRGEAEG